MDTPAQIKVTPLQELHLTLGGRMTDFAGYRLPLHYAAGIIREHLHCRNLAGFFDISHMGQFVLTGNRAIDEFSRLIPSRLDALQPGRQKYTVLTNAHGGILDDIILTRLENGLKIVANAACKAKVFGYLDTQLSNACTITERQDLSLFAIQGPSSAGIIGQHSPAAAQLPFMTACETAIGGIPCTVSRCGYTGEDGFEISVSNERAAELAECLLVHPELMPAGLGARDTLRLEAGLCLFGHELSETITPVEAGLAWVIDKTRTDYPGANKILRQLSSGAESVRAGLTADSKIPVREHCIVLDADGREAGKVTSGSYSPSLQKPVAMAYVSPRYSAIGTRLFTEVRGQAVPVTITALPFVPHRYIR